LGTKGEAEKMAPSSNHATTYDLTQYPISVGMQSMAGGLCYPLPPGKAQIDSTLAVGLFFFFFTFTNNPVSILRNGEKKREVKEAHCSGMWL
jgi:hypothetical protein